MGHLRPYRSAFDALNASQYIGTAIADSIRTPMSTLSVGLTTTQKRASSVMSGAQIKRGLRPTASVIFPHHPDIITCKCAYGSSFSPHGPDNNKQAQKHA
jgi:hypothetical protein